MCGSPSKTDRKSEHKGKKILLTTIAVVRKCFYLSSMYSLNMSIIKSALAGV